MHAPINFFSASFLDDPYPYYRQMQADSPMLPQPGLRGTDWVLTRYADIRAVLCDKQAFGVDDVPRTVLQTGTDSTWDDRVRLSDNIRHWLFFVDPPIHTQWRSKVARSFSRQAVAGLAEYADQQLQRLLPAQAGWHELDVISDIGTPLPARLMLQLLGISGLDPNQVAAQGSRIFAVFQQPMSPQRYADLGAEVRALEALISTVIQAPEQYLNEQGLLRGMLKTVGDAAGADSSDHQQSLLGFVTMLLSVGQDTTKHLLGNSLLAIAQAPAAWQQLAEHPAWLDAAVDELARIDTPVQLVVRTAKTDSRVGGETIRAGQRMHLFLGAGLRDPEVFEAPDEINFQRAESGNLPFGAGPHFCLGAYIARVASHALLKHLVRPGRRPPMVYLDQAQRQRSVHLRGFKSLPMRLDLAP